MKPLQITSYTLTSAAGIGNDASWQALKNEQSGLAPCHFFAIDDLKTYVGEITAIDEVVLPAELTLFDCRNNRLCELGLQQDGFLLSVQQAIEKYGAKRIGVFMGTSTSGIHQTEQAYLQASLQTSLAATEAEDLPRWYDYQHTHNVYSITDYVCQRLGLLGPSEAISTACSSSAKVFASAHRAIELGLCDAAVVGGVDSLCLTTLYGFNALQVVSTELCMPSDVNRQGLSIGEAAGFALVERFSDNTKPQISGYGESSDAYHMSSPHPEGLGALAAMQQALERANLSVTAIDYVNLHGTGTPANDLAESNAVVSLLGQVPASSTKGWTGHTLGAAGIAEVVISLLCIKNCFIPKSLNTQIVDLAIKANIVMQSQNKPMQHVISNSFGFGGSNCSLVITGASNATVCK